MKIGIISINMFSKGLNFACPLHNFAFQQFLLKNKIDNTIISYTPVYFNDFNLRHPYEYYKKICDNMEKNGKKELDPDNWQRFTELRDEYQALYNERERRYDKFQNFIDTNYIKTDKIYDADLLEVEDPGFDCYICCTDVIWKKEPGFGFDRGFFLACSSLENKWKISYAASRGVYHSENEEDEKTFLHYIDDIDAVSVREKFLAEYLRKNISQDVTEVLDPVLLHEKEFYYDFMKKPEEEHYLFLYYVQEKAEATIEQAVKYARVHNLKIVEITDRPIKGGRLQQYTDVEVIYNYDMGIEEWLGYIRYADAVFTNSFHCCCFSILFEKELFVGFRMGDKVTHVLEMFDMLERKFERESDLINNPLPKTDYEKVKKIMAEKRKESSEFILNAIHAMENKEKQKKDYGWWKRRQTYPIHYNSGVKDEVKVGTFASVPGKTRRFSSGSTEFTPERYAENDGMFKLLFNGFGYHNHIPAGWRIRFRIGKRWYWYLEDHTYVERTEYSENNEKYSPLKIFREGERIPFIPLNGIKGIVAEAIWEEGMNSFDVVYNGGRKSRKLQYQFDESKGTVFARNDLSVEYRMSEAGINDGTSELLNEHYSIPHYKCLGRKMRIKDNDKWYWYMADGSLKLIEPGTPETGERYIFKEESKIPYIPAGNVSVVVFESIWQPSVSAKCWHKVKKLVRPAKGKENE